MRSETLSRLLKNTGNHLTRAAQNRARALAITYRAATGREQSAPEPVTSKSWPVSNAGVSRIWTKAGNRLLTRAVRNRAHALAIAYRAAGGRERSRGAVFQHPIRHRSATEPVTIESWQVSNAGVSRILTKTRHLLLTRAARNRAHALAIAYRAATIREQSQQTVCQRPLRSILTSSSRALDPHVR